MSDDALAQLDRSHRRHDDEMHRLIEAATAGDLDAIADAIAFLERSSPRHFGDEEESLFPRLRAHDPTLGPALDRIVAEHRDHEKRHARLRVRCDAGDAPAVLTEAEALEATYRRHVAEEDEVIFPRARALLTPEDHTAILAEMDARRGRKR
jgi:hemerythrin-like domain-containing protein